MAFFFLIFSIMFFLLIFDYYSLLPGYIYVAPSLLIAAQYLFNLLLKKVCPLDPFEYFLTYLRVV